MKILTGVGAYIVVGMACGLIAQYIDARDRSLERGRIVVEPLPMEDWSWCILGWPILLIGVCIIGSGDGLRKVYTWILTRTIGAELIRRELSGGK